MRGVITITMMTAKTMLVNAMKLVAVLVRGLNIHFYLKFESDFALSGLDVFDNLDSGDDLSEDESSTLDIVEDMVSAEQRAAQLARGVSKVLIPRCMQLTDCRSFYMDVVLQ